MFFVIDFFKTLTKGPPLSFVFEKTCFFKTQTKDPAYFFSKISDFATDNPPSFLGFWSEEGGYL